MARRLFRAQMVVSSRFDRAFLPPEYRIDGNTCFDSEFIAPFLRPQMTVIDVGGGKRPALSLERKVALELRVIGFDISRSELEAAPQGSYAPIWRSARRLWSTSRMLIRRCEA